MANPPSTDSPGLTDDVDFARRGRAEALLVPRESMLGIEPQVKTKADDSCPNRKFIEMLDEWTYPKLDIGAMDQRRRECIMDEKGSSKHLTGTEST